MRINKEIKFLELKQGNSTVVEYAAMIEELVKFYQHYTGVTAKGSKCVKFESGLRPKIKQGIGYQEILQFYVLVNKCRIYDEGSRARFSHYKSFSGKKGKDQNRGKFFQAPTDKGKQKAGHKAIGGKERSGRGIPTSVRCFKYGEFGHHAHECKSTTVNCFKCGKPCHRATDCRSNNPTYFNYGEQSHISTQCGKPNKAQS
ncbi:uncharacterized protein LOC127135968 [Lathyrus oleraceus]|uniref:uncharacterized protein LOC127135968 n=1 Tax=Pisum sativum TaxID=3888 RepID=UPI0021D353BE|nr:uncharacterized protein LOC127135968 [Pisum sativum]